MEQAMNPLPTANPETTQFFRQWLETFAGYVREVDYAAARQCPAGEPCQSTGKGLRMSSANGGLC
jgi:hypothetical protein